MKAFSHTGSFGPDAYQKQGMDLRDWFASQADVSEISFDDIPTACRILGMPEPDLDLDDSAEMLAFFIKMEAKLRYMHADAMMEARDGH